MTRYKRGNLAKCNTVIKPLTSIRYFDRFKDLTNTKFDKLLVLKCVGINYRRHAVWSCLCDCGNKINLAGNCIRSGNVRSCGCLTKERIKACAKGYAKNRALPMQKFALNSLYSAYRSTAKMKNRKFELTKHHFEQLIKSECHYCGEVNSNCFTRNEEVFRYNGIDRKDSSLGYEVQNVVPCCVKCNHGKLAYTQDEFLQWIKKVYAKNF